MNAKKIGFSIVYRDMWQSAGKYVPRVDQLLKVAPFIIEMGCFERIETNGGGFEQINLLFGENPNKAVRSWTKPFNNAGIKTHMLERALNGIRMSPVPEDVRRLFYKVKKAQGVDISRSFCGLNDPRNLENSIRFAKEAGMISQAALSITYSEVHTVDYYIDLANKLIEMGADEICVKDMAGIGRPVWLGKIVQGIKKEHPHILIQYHAHSGPGFSVASILEVCRSGADLIDVAMEPLSWGTGHADLLTVQEMLRDAGFDVPDINMTAYMKVRQLTQSFMDDFLSFYISKSNRVMNSLLIGPGLPGGMMGSLMADLEVNLKTINKWKLKNDKPEITEDELLIKLFEEVKYAWPRLGYPPLVTPFSQYVKNVAMMNVIQIEKGSERWSLIPETVWEMILGKSGHLPGPLDNHIVELAKSEGRVFFTGVPQEEVPNQLDSFKEEMKENGWDFGQDDEELFELAMHPEQYRAYKSGRAKADFEIDLASKRISRKSQNDMVVKDIASTVSKPKRMDVEVNGLIYRVNISYPDQNCKSPVTSDKTSSENLISPTNSIDVLAPLEGKFYLTKSVSEKPLSVGERIKEGDLICYIESMKTMNAIRSEYTGIVTSLLKKDGDLVDEDDLLVKIQK